MPDVFQDTLDVYRRRQARGVGGPYGQAAKPLLGWDPPINVIFFDDAVEIRFDGNNEDTQTENHYQTPAWDFPEAEINEVIGDPDPIIDVRTEVFIKLERPVLTIQSALLHILPILSCGLDEADFMAIDAILICNLIKVPLNIATDPVNPFGLDQLTWDNSNWTTRTSGHGTFYNDPDNLELLGSVEKILYEFNTADNTPSEEAVRSLASDPKAQLIGIIIDPTTDKGVDGPYFGVHIAWESRLRNPNITNPNIGDVGDSENVRAVLNNTRINAPAGHQRSFVLVREFYPFIT